MSAFRIGIVGGGGISGAHVAAARASAGRVQVVAGVDPSEAARRALSQSTRAPMFASFEQVLQDRAITMDGVVVCTPPSIRIPIVKAALERGISVLLEKPIAHNVADAKTLVDLAAAHAQVVTGVAYCHRFVPAVLEMKRCAAAGELGTLIRFENTFAGWNPGMQSKWMSDVAQSGGGSFMDTGCHSLDLLRFLLGDATVRGAIYSRQWEGRGESNATVLLDAGGIAGVIESGWLEPVKFVVTLTGTRGRLSYDYDRPEELSWQPSEGSAQVRAVASHETRFDRQMLAWAEVASGRVRERDGLATFEDGLRVAQLVDEAGTADII